MNTNAPDPMLEEAVHKLLATANLFRMRGQYDEAQEKCSEALRLYPRNIEAMEMMGDLLYERGRLDEALHQYKAAIDLLPTPSLETKYARMLLRIEERERERQKAEAALARPKAAVRRKRSPATALMLSAMVPGMGQFYNGEIVKGLIIIGVWGICTLWALSSPFLSEFLKSLLSTLLRGEGARGVSPASATIGGSALFPIAIGVSCWLYSIIDAPLSATRQTESGVKTGFEV